LVTPLEMACFAASVARDEVYTKPTLLHDPEGKPQHTERIGLTPAQRAALIAGMVGCTTPAYATSTARNLASPLYRIPGISVAGKTGTAQKRVKIADKIGTINFAWFICFAPAENPEIAVAVMLEGDTIGESFGGGANAGPVANAILKKYFEKKNRPANPAFQPFKLN
jgi:penicillin-binding protein 2